MMSADTDLISRAAGGDSSAFQALVERHRSMVYRVAYQFAGNHHDAEDIAQEVFIKVYRSLDRFRQDSQLSSWMYRIVMNACIDHRRRQTPAGAAPAGACRRRWSMHAFMTMRYIHELNCESCRNRSSDR